VRRSSCRPAGPPSAMVTAEAGMEAFEGDPRTRRSPRVASSTSASSGSIRVQADHAPVSQAYRFLGLPLPRPRGDARGPGRSSWRRSGGMADVQRVPTNSVVDRTEDHARGAREKACGPPRLFAPPPPPARPLAAETRPLRSNVLPPAPYCGSKPDESSKEHLSARRLADRCAFKLNLRELPLQPVG